MNKAFYPKLALSNLKKNSKTYIPFLITCIITTAMYYIIYSLSTNSGLDQMPGGTEIKALLRLGVGIIAIFSVIFLFYTNSFLVKRRKKEFGLYNILGMEKKHLGILIAYECLITLLCSILLGLAVGISLDKVMFLIIGNILKTDVPFGFHISLRAIKSTAFLFSIIHILIYLNSTRQIHVCNPIELLNSSSAGEKEPKAKWFLSLLGILFIVSGYYISLTTENPLEAISLFFVAVLCVIIGTYLLFITGSITILKILKKNKRFYYKTNHFTSISGMIYRMKQNAAGLANICILSTMVLVTVSSTVSLWSSIDDLIVTRYPKEITLTLNSSDSQRNKQLLQETYQYVDTQNLHAENLSDYSYLAFSALYDDGQYITDRSAWTLSNLNNSYNLFFITLDEYNQNCNTAEQLADDEILIYSDRTEIHASTIQLFGKEYKVKKKLDTFVKNGSMMANAASTHYIVVKDMDILNELVKQQNASYGDLSTDIKYYIGFDTDGNQEQNIALYTTLQKNLQNNYQNLNIESRSDSYHGFLSLYGGFMFLGLFLSVLFIMAAVLIIYYKQISEGYEDRERYEIMQKVGMDHKTVKQTINFQVLMVFFLPLLTAAIHTIFAFPIISRLLKAMMFTNTKLLILCTAGCIISFAAVYILIYLLTSKLYYSIVKR